MEEVNTVSAEEALTPSLEENLTENTTQLLNQEYLVGPNDISIPGEMAEFMPLISWGIVIFNILMLVFFALKAWGLYNINKKLGEPYPWLAWIPVIQIYSFVKAGGKNGIWVFWIILGFMALIIPGIILYIIVAHGISKRTGRSGWSTLGIVFVDFIMLPVIGSKLQAKSTIESSL
jgi:Family of unknown function (DUF5684)